MSIVTVLCLVAPVAFAQEGFEGYQTFELSLANPGARSMGFAGAFVAQADDATAAFVNPAGLVQLLRKEVSFELRASYNRMTEESEFDLINGLSTATFFSFVYPLHDLSVAAYRHQLVNYDRLEDSDLVGVTDGNVTEWPTALEVVNWGVAVGYRVSDRLRVGAGLSYVDGKGETAAIAPSTQNLDTIDSTDLSFNAGFLWGSSEGFRLGGYYRDGATFDVEPSARPDLSLPDAFGLGMAYRCLDGGLTLALEWDHVGYSSVAEYLNGREAAGTPVVLDDGDEYHVGVEYVFVATTPIIALRAGAWRDPDHLARTIREEPGEEELHFTSGIGIVMSGLQIDLGIDVTNTHITGSISGIFSF